MESERLADRHHKSALRGVRRPDGLRGASCTMVGDPNSAYLFQSVATTAGTSYTLSFFYDSGQLATTASELLVLWGDPTAASLSTVLDFVNVDTSGAYVEYTGAVSATSAVSELEFLGRQDFDFYSVDDIALTPPATSIGPEPSCFGILGTMAVVWMVLRSFSRWARLVRPLVPSRTIPASAETAHL